MKDIFSNIIIISFLGSYFLSFLNTEGKLHRYTGYILSLIIISMLLSPIGSFITFCKDAQKYLNFDSENTKPDYTVDGTVLIVQETDKEIKRGISDIAKAKYEIMLPVDNIRIEYDTSDIEKIEIKHIYISVNNTILIKNLNEFCYYISDMFMCKCEVEQVDD